MSVPDDTQALLTQLGFTDTEALTYHELLRHPGSTGYGVAKAIKKSQANVYSALSSLTAKGAVAFDHGEVRAYRAVAPAELLPRLAKEFQERCAAAQVSLSRLDSPAGEDRIYQLRNANQVYDRAASMCASACESVAFELFHSPFQRLKGPLAAAAARGVGVAGVTFNAEDEVPGASCVLAVKASRARWWPGEQLTIVTDARQALVALFDRESDAVLHAVHTDSVYLACLLHAAVVDASILNRENPPVLATSLNKRLFGTIPGGFLQLISEQRSKKR
ncbi:MAG TPA: helix-turn-helix domain-containing protein [Allosphingosinicella sp.]|jgi:sugar-specific transcriptional regulator TrmB